MAFTQDKTALDNSDAVGISPVAVIDANDNVYTPFPGGLQFFTGEGAPDIAAAKGSLAIDKAAGKLYICTVATGTWAVVGSQS